MSSGPAFAGRIWFVNKHLEQLWMDPELPEGMLAKRKDGVKIELSLLMSFRE